LQTLTRDLELLHDFAGAREYAVASVDECMADGGSQVTFPAAGRTSNILPIIKATTSSFAIRFTRASASASMS
jgi:hypothetical protein